MSLNKGEWSEVYTFLKLIADGRLYAADSNLNKINNIYFPILKILRDEPNGLIEFSVDSKIKVFNQNGIKQLEISINEFKQKSIELLGSIKNSTKKTFEIPNISDFMHSINITKLKERSNKKRDITIVVHDIFTGHNPTLGFSIKSRLGGLSTLINASKLTKFIFKLDNILPDKTIDKINKIKSNRKIKDRISEIELNGSNLVYFDMLSKDFKRNLIMIDSKFPLIVAEMLKIYFKGKGTLISEIAERIKKINPCNFDLTCNHPFYEYKIKNFLTDCALGMTPKAIWEGSYDANGGYIIVKEDGEIVCYHLYNRNEFQEYLFNNTKLETSSSKRHIFGSIFKENGSQYLKLNLQVRFL